MSSALQCLNQTPELSLYFRVGRFALQWASEVGWGEQEPFLSPFPFYSHIPGEYEADINTSNPLGHGGKLAKAYAALCNELWDDNAKVLTYMVLCYLPGTDL